VFGVAQDAAGIKAHEELAFQLYSEVGDDAGIERARQALSLAAFIGGDLEGAREFNERNIDAYRRLGSLALVADSLTLLSAIDWQMSDAEASWQHLAEGLRLFAERDLVSGLARALGMAAIVLLRFGDPVLGARVAGTTAELQRTKGVMIAPARVLHLPDPAEFATQILGEERAAQLMAEGAATSPARMAELVLAPTLTVGVDRAPIQPPGLRSG